MTVTETKQATGSWSLRLRDDTPRALTDLLDYYGHIVIATDHVNPDEYGDTLLAPANSRYVGVLLGRAVDDTEDREIRGKGMAFWLGDSQNTADFHESAVTLSAVSFVAAITALLPPHGSVTAGVISPLAGTYTNTHQYISPRDAIDYVTQLYGAEWRVNGNGTLDAGLVADLYRTTPLAILQRKPAGDDLDHRALVGDVSTDTDVEDYTTRVFLLAEGEGDAIATGAANAAPTPYNDIHGNDVWLTRLVSESETTAANANSRAAVILDAYDATRSNIKLSSENYDVKGDVVVGDYIFVHDPATGLFDLANEVYWEGEAIHPISLRCIEMTFPIRDGWGVFFRRVDGSWLDLTDYVEFESGGTEIVVGQVGHNLASLGSTPVGDRPNLPNGVSDITFPNIPAFLGSSTGSYQSMETNTTKAAIWLQWTTPLNTDSSVITDGDRYEIRYRVDIPIGYKIRWGQLAPYRWGQLATSKWGAPLSAPVSATPEWQTAVIGWDTNEFTLTELTAGIPYEIEIRAVDIYGHVSAWSSPLTVTTTGDLLAPSTPSAPTVAGSRIAIQVVHNLGKNTGGTFNLELDLDHLNVHVGGDPSFYPDKGNRVGRLIANSGMILGSIPAVGSFSIEPTETVWCKVVAVDRAGNESGASPAASVTAQLIDDAHISNLSVSKITAGQITADWLLAATIRTAVTGARAELASNGLTLYNTLGLESVKLDSNTANIRLRKGRLEVVDDDLNVIVELGLTSDGRYGMRVNNTAGSPQIRIGQLTNLTSYGLEAVDNFGNLVSLSTLAFGLTADYQNGGFSLPDTNSDYIEAPDGLGPNVDVMIGQSGRAIVMCGAEINLQSNDGTSNNYCTMSWRVSGASVLSASSIQGQRYYIASDTITGDEVFMNFGAKATTAYAISGLNPGLNTFTAMYSSFLPAGRSCTVNNRILIVMPY